MLEIGTEAPAFTLPDQDGREVTLASLIATGPLLLYFYPADFTPGCTRQACMFRDELPEAEAVGLQIVGVSPQEPDSHQRFRERYGLPFSLLSDPDRRVIRAYDVDGPFGFGVRRASYLIDRDGSIADRLLADLMIDRHRVWLEQIAARFGRAR